MTCLTPLGASSDRIAVVGDLLLVSVLIRVRDEAAPLVHVLRALRTQVLDERFEIVVLDNESVDGSDKVAVEHGAKVFTFPRALFGYGRALNLGVGLCEGDIVVLLSAHSIPQSNTWLADLIRPLREETAGVAFCRQVPAGRLSRLERRRFACFPSWDTVMTKEDFERVCANGRDPYQGALFSSSACAIRRGAAIEHPFRDLLYAEDRALVVDYLMGGGAVAYVHAAIVSYERRMTWRSAYRAGYRAQVSKRLIRELAAAYTGYRYDSGTETRSRLWRALLVAPGALLRLLVCVCEPRGHRLRAAVHALRSTGATLGMARGSVGWRRHMDGLGCNTERLRQAREQCRPISLGAD